METSTQSWTISRGKSLRLGNPYIPPPGDLLEHSAVGFAKTLCSAVFITGLKAEIAKESTGFFTGSYEDRKKFSEPVIDYAKKEVRITIPERNKTFIARYLGSQGCVVLPDGTNELFFKPIQVIPKLPDPSKAPWPMGDILESSIPLDIDPLKLKQAIDAAFDPPETCTSAFVVTCNGRLIGERYGEGINHNTPLESWSMGKSITATLMGILIQQGEYVLEQPAPIPEWQTEGDPRKEIRICDLLRMSSGIQCRSPFDPDYEETEFPSDHKYLYTGRINSFKFAATRPQEWKPNTVGRYRNADPVLINYLIRLAVEKRGEEYHSFPQRHLFDKIGVRSCVIECDPHGNFLAQGYDFMSGRDWARWGNLFLQDGVWNGQRILPEGYVKFVSTVAPAWAADQNPVYGGFFWINGNGEYPVDRDVFFAAGAGGQEVFIIPSKKMVVVRIGFSKGEPYEPTATKRALALLMEAIK